jgi:flagellar basal body P-ring formation protein FlgA
MLRAAFARTSVFNALLLAAFVSFAFSCASFAWAGEPARLRQTISVSGPAVTLGDLFENAGAAASRVVAPAPAAGRSSTFSARFVETAARAAGLEWTAPQGLSVIAVAGDGALASRSGSASGGDGVRKGELVTLVFASAGVRISTRLRALQDGAEGDLVRLQNPESGRTVEALVTGPGSARALNR